MGGGSGAGNLVQQFCQQTHRRPQAAGRNEAKLVSHFDVPPVCWSWTATNSLVILWWQLSFVPLFNKLLEQIMSRLRRKIREIFAFFFLQPGCKLVVLWEVVIFGYFFETLFQCKKKKKERHGKLKERQGQDQGSLYVNHFCLGNSPKKKITSILARTYVPNWCIQIHLVHSVCS